MGLFGFGGVGHQMEENAVQSAMRRIGAREGTHLENCERCSNYVSASQAGSKYFGGCRRFDTKVFANYVCGNFSR